MASAIYKQFVPYLLNVAVYWAHVDWWHHQPGTKEQETWGFHGAGTVCHLDRELYPGSTEKKKALKSSKTSVD
jgi:hypothetical protein